MHAPLNSAPEKIPGRPSTGHDEGSALSRAVCCILVGKAPTNWLKRELAEPLCEIAGKVAGWRAGCRQWTGAEAQR